MKRINYILIFAVVLSFLNAQHFSGQNSNYSDRHGVMAMVSAPDPQRPDKDRISERMEMMMTWKLTNDLDLTPEQADKFFPRFKEHREDMNKIDQDIRDITEGVRKDIDSGKEITEKEFNKVITEFCSLEKLKIEEKEKFLEEIGDILNNNQKTKLLLFKQYFMEDLQRQIKKRQSRGT